MSWPKAFPFLALAFVAGCASMQAAMDPTVYKPQFGLELTQVERPASATQRYGPSTITTLHDTSVSRYAFEDQLVKIVAFADQKRIYVQIQNKTDHSIKIVWNDAAFVDTQGKSDAVMHAGVKYTDCASPKAPSVIVQHGSIDDEVIPCSRVSFGYSSWIIGDLIPTVSVKAVDTTQAATDAKSYVGKHLQLLLPLQIEDTVNDYLLTFAVTTATLHPTTMAGLLYGR